MSASAVLASSTWTNNANTYTHGPITLPSGIAVGDLLLCVFSCDGNAEVAASSGWTKLGQATYSSYVSGTIFWKLATGSDALTVTSSYAEQASAIVWRISKALGVEGYYATGSSANPDPPALTPSFDPTNALWVVTHSGDGTTVCSSAPSGIGLLVHDFQTKVAGTTSGASSGIAGIDATVSTLNPGSFTALSEQWVCWTLAIRPLPSAEIQVDGPLGAPALVGCFGDPQAILESPGPLGSAPELLLDAPPVAVLDLPGPLGAEPALVGIIPTTLTAQVRGPLGRRSRVRMVIEDVLALVAIASPLGAPSLRARHRAPIEAWWSVAGPLGLPRLFAQQRFVTPLTPAAGAAANRPRLLSDPIPLRRASVLPGYREDVVLPWVFGRVTLTPVALDAAGLEWLVADHPIVEVTAVRAGGSLVTGWQLVQALDATGTAVARLRLTQPPDDDLAVTVVGRRHPVTGAVLEHPADIAEEILRACGWSVPVDAFAALRDAYPDVVLGGVLDQVLTVREAVSRVLGSVDAEWSAYPLRAFTARPGDPMAVLTPATCSTASAEATHASLANTLRVTYGYDWAEGEPRGSLTVHAPEVLADQGELAHDLDLPWVRTARDALALAAAALDRRARPLWSLRLEVATHPRYQPGDTLTLDHPWVPSGPVMITTVDHAPTGQTLTARRWAGEPPRVELVARGARLDAAGEEAIQVSYRDGVATFTVLDDLGHPLANAAVTLDGTQTRTTDRSGLVQFTTPRGAHTLLIVAAGYATQELEVIV